MANIKRIDEYNSAQGEKNYGYVQAEWSKFKKNYDSAYDNKCDTKTYDKVLEYIKSLPVETKISYWNRIAPSDMEVLELSTENLRDRIEDMRRQYDEYELGKFYLDLIGSGKQFDYNDDWFYMIDGNIFSEKSDRIYPNTFDAAIIMTNYCLDDGDFSLFGVEYKGDGEDDLEAVRQQLCDNGHTGIADTIVRAFQQLDKYWE